MLSILVSSRTEQRKDSCITLSFFLTSVTVSVQIDTFTDNCMHTYINGRLTLMDIAINSLLPLQGKNSISRPNCHFQTIQIFFMNICYCKMGSHSLMGLLLVYEITLKYPSFLAFLSLYSPTLGSTEFFTPTSILIRAS